MYPSMTKHKVAKILVLILIGVAIGFFLRPAINLIGGVNVPLSSLIGDYANGISHQLYIYEDGVGRSVHEGRGSDFFYSYYQGRFECRGMDGDFSMRALQDGGIYDLSSNIYFVRRN